ncbi:uncharacterized protein LOC129909461 [Episyrphus balteatus]|uniref:uncharacterized protein LOC129909461 n=1 Tax=Episyrphus balteatus TaxID=286459 RepID=UPI002486549F|nr:uncharacterized protein LOC129909461 [Episyrphus balteatus]
MFTAVYANHPKLCAVQKLYHLRSKTRGEASNIVCKFPLTAGSFDLAWEALKDRFENRRILVNTQLKTLFNMPYIAQESSVGIKNIQRDINDCLSALKVNKIDTSNWDSILVYLCSSRLPDVTLSLWEQSIENPRKIPTWSELDTFLTNRFQVLETVSDIRLKPKPKATFTKTHSTQPSHERIQQSYHSKQINYTCKLCDQNHPLRFCNKFLQMTTDDRIKTVKSHNYCSNCLATSHVEKDCKSTYTCIQCKERHHSLLHPLSVNQSHFTNYSSDLNSAHSSSFIQSTQPQAQDSSYLHSYYSSNRNRVILATALVIVEHHGISFTLRALLDPGSEVTFISEEAQTRLKLPAQSIEAHISGINAVITANASKLCSLILRSNQTPDLTLSVNAIVLKRLTGDLPSCCIEQFEISQPIDFPLADPDFKSSSKVDLVLGADIHSVSTE